MRTQVLKISSVCIIPLWSVESQLSHTPMIWFQKCWVFSFIVMYFLAFMTDFQTDGLVFKPVLGVHASGMCSWTTWCIFTRVWWIARMGCVFMLLWRVSHDSHHWEVVAHWSCVFHTCMLYLDQPAVHYKMSGVHIFSTN